MNTSINIRGGGTTWYHVLFLILLFLLPQKSLAVVETVRYSLNPEDIKCTPKLDINGNAYFSVEWKGVGYQENASVGADRLNDIVSFLVPSNSTNFRVSVVILPGNPVVHELKRMEIPTKYTPPRYPERTDIINQEEASATALLNYEILPGEILSEGFIFGDWHIVKVKVKPIRYSEIDESLRIDPNLEIILEYDECNDNTYDSILFPNSIISPEIVTAESINIIKSIDFINKESANRLIDSKSPSSGSYSNIEKYYIIVPQNLIECVQDLSLWKSQKGYDVTVKTIESILADPLYQIGGTSLVTGEKIFDEASALRAYLQNQFKKNGVFYCFLIGDWRTSMPIRKYAKFTYYSTIAHNYNGEEFFPSDDYFSDLTTKNGFYTIKSNTGDLAAELHCALYPDICVGRLLCSSPQEVKNYFEKLRIYESFPGKGDDDYLTAAMYFENNPKCDNPQNGLYSLVDESVESMHSLDIFSEIIYARDRDESKGFPDHSMEMKGSNIIRYMHRTGYNSWLGHGHPAGILTCGGHNFIIPINSYTRGSDGQVGRDENPDDIDNGLDLIDNVNYPSITYSSACCIAPFDRFEGTSHIYDLPYNIAGAYTVSGTNGGVAIIANSRDAGVFSGKSLQLCFSQQVQLTPKLGIAHKIAKAFSALTDDETNKTSNLIGDPDIEMWLNRPYHFNNQSSSQGAILNDHVINIKGAKYSVYDGSNCIDRFVCDGTEDINLATYASYMPMISIWKQGYLPKLTLYVLEGHFTNVNKKYFTQEAIFGNLDTSKQCIVGKDASIEIDVMSAIDINDGFHVEDGGKVDITCHEDITASGELVKTGGNVNLRGKKIVLKSGFKVNLGGVINISTL